MAMNLGKLVLAEFTEELSFLIKGKRIYFGNSKFFILNWAIGINKIGEVINIQIYSNLAIIVLWLKVTQKYGIK